MLEAINKAIQILTARITPATECNEALKLTQAALNLAHTAQVAAQVDHMLGGRTS